MAFFSDSLDVFPKMDSNLYYLNREVEKIHDSKRKHTLVLKIPDFMWLLDNQTNREIRTEKPKKDNTECFQVMMKLVGHQNELIEIYYRTHTTVHLKPTLSVWINNVRSNYRNGSYSTLANQEYQCVPNEWQFLAMQFKSNIKSENRLFQNYMELQFEFFVSHNSNLTKKLSYTHLNNKNSEELDNGLTNDTTSLLMNPVFSDVMMISVEGDEFRAHKVFLATRSTVFKAHFEHDTVESRTNVVQFPFNTDVLKDVLTYIYKDVSPNVEELSSKLLEAADFYQLNGLKKRCEIALEKKLTVENAIETLELANLHGARYLMKKTLEFIKDGLAKDITETDAWKTLQSVEVVKSVYESVVEK